MSVEPPTTQGQDSTPHESNEGEALTLVTKPEGRTYISRHHLALLISIAIIILFLSIQSPYFLQVDNLLNVLQQISFVAIIGYGMTLALVAGEIDISVGSMMGFSSALLGALYVRQDWPLWLALITVFVIAGLTGSFVGWLRHFFNVPSFILTLGMFSILSGAALLISNAMPVGISSTWLVAYGTAKPFGIPSIALVMFVVLAVVGFIAKRTVFGRSVYAVGGNSSAAYLSGISLVSVRVGVLTLTALLAALAGILASATTGSADSALGGGIEFQVFGAVIIGGTLLSGGRGSVIGTFLGALLVGLLNNGMVLLGVPSFTQNVAGGVVLVLAVLITSPRMNVSTASLTRRLQSLRKALSAPRTLRPEKGGSKDASDD
jgi:ribose/xylose/arabinose/galactoside ABC-type transport system permease subunit